MCSGPHSRLGLVRLEPTQASQGAELTLTPIMRVAWQVAWGLLGMCLHTPAGSPHWPLQAHLGSSQASGPC